MFVNNGKYLIDDTVDGLGGSDCSEWLDNYNTSKDLMWEYSECEWDSFNQMIIVTLSSYSTITLNDGLMIKDNILFFAKMEDGSHSVNITNEEVIVEEMGFDFENAIVPVIVLSNLENEIGVCDDLVLDARNSYNLGVMLCVVSIVWHVLGLNSW